MNNSLTNTLSQCWLNFINKSVILIKYWKINDLIWQEGLFFDFLQKKISDNWIKKFLIISSNLFNERLVFDKVIRFYLILIIWPAHKYSLFDIGNVSSLINFSLGILYLCLISFFFLLML